MSENSTYKFVILGEGRVGKTSYYLNILTRNLVRVNNQQ